MEIITFNRSNVDVDGAKESLNTSINLNNYKTPVEQLATLIFHFKKFMHSIGFDDKSIFIMLLHSYQIEKMVFNLYNDEGEVVEESPTYTTEEIINMVFPNSEIDDEEEDEDVPERDF